MPSLDWFALETILARDPLGRGVPSYRQQGRLLAAGQLEAASQSLARRGAHVAIVTGFCVAGSEPPAAETDGPPGALYLARALSALAIDVTLLSDAIGLPLLALGREHWGLDQVALAEIPFADAGQIGPWIDGFFAARGRRRLTHLVAIERAGPSHTLQSLTAGRRVPPPVVERFQREVPEAHRNVCHNMRGDSIDTWTAPAHLLFEAIAARRLAIETIGLADGGNEIGAGAVAWEILREAIARGPAGRVACRIATTYLLLAGISNWAAYALAGAVAVLRGRRELLSAWNAADQRLLIETLVREGGALDGVSGLRRATVDGLPLETYLETKSEISSVISHP